jgi:hypothetical protein
MINLGNKNLVSHLAGGMAMIIIGTSLDSTPVSAAVVNNIISGNFTDGSTFTGNFSYDTNAADNSPSLDIGKFNLLSFEIFINNTLFVSSTTGTLGKLSRFNFSDPTSALLEFGSTIGIPEAPPPTGMTLSLTGVNNPSNVNQAPVSLATADGITVTSGGATSPLPIFPKTVVPGSVSISVPSVPEPTSSLSLLAFGTLGAASTLKRKLKPSQTSEKETTKVG